MAGYVMIGGHNTWVDDARRSEAEQPVLLLHGGLSDSDLLGDAIAPTIGDAGFGIVSFDRRGHGRNGDTDAPFHYADMAEETIAVLEQVVGAPADLVGFSDGGNIALPVTLGRPDLGAAPWVQRARITPPKASTSTSIPKTRLSG